jgi:NADH-quinone oxidoreductase subunit N
VTERIMTLWPEITLFTAVVLVLFMGLAHNLTARKAVPFVTAAALVIAGILSAGTEIPGALLPDLASFLRTFVCIIGLLLLMLCGGVAPAPTEERAFDPTRTTRPEFYAFFLLSLMGLMLTTTATDLIWLFLSLELTSLPTYVLVATSTKQARSREAGVKYFFLGALGAAIFLYGFAMLYGGTGTLRFAEMATLFEAEGVNGLAILGLVMAVVGIGFKIAAVPMHLYTPDVYEGAATPVSAFLAFVPKTAGFVALLLLVSTITSSPGALLPDPLAAVLTAMAVVTMTVGNVLATLQTNVKRILAYSSIAHSGYMLIGILAGPGDGSITSSGYGAVVFYLVCYGIMNLGAFGVLASLQLQGREIETLADLKGLCRTNPGMGWTMVLCAGSLMGLPPLLGFFGKLYLFAAGISNGLIALVVVAGINSAIAAFYYLRMATPPLTQEPTERSGAIRGNQIYGRWLASAISAVGVVVLVVTISPLVGASHRAAQIMRIGDDQVPIAQAPIVDPKATRKSDQ